MHLILALFVATAQAAPVKIEVVELHGTLTAGGKTLKTGDVVDGAAPIALSKGGDATLRLEQGLILLEGPATFTADPDALDLKAGAMLSVLKKLKRRWSVKTPNAVAAVRGTTFYIESAPSDTYLCLCQGAVDVSSPGSKKVRHLKSKTHTAFTFKSLTGELSGERATFKGHTDAQIAALKARL